MEMTLALPDGLFARVGGQPLGQGTYGTVLRGECSNGAQLAIKRVPCDTPLNLERYQHERRLLLRCASAEHVCQCLYALMLDSYGFLVLPRAIGSLLDLRARVDVEQSAAHMITAVAELHERGITHRDLKLDNFLVTAHGVEITDLGLATDATRMYTMDVQTHWFRAPELFLHAAPYTSAVDLWALGLVIAHLWRGEAPYQGTAREVFQSIFEHRSVPAPSESVALSAYARAPIAPAPGVQQWIDELAQLNPTFRTRASVLAGREAVRAAARAPFRLTPRDATRTARTRSR